MSYRDGPSTDYNSHVLIPQRFHPVCKLEQCFGKSNHTLDSIYPFSSNMGSEWCVFMFLTIFFTLHPFWGRQFKSTSSVSATSLAFYRYCLHMSDSSLSHCRDCGLPKGTGQLLCMFHCFPVSHLMRTSQCSLGIAITWKPVSALCNVFRHCNNMGASQCFMW